MFDGLPLDILDGIGVVGAALLLVVGFASDRLYTRGQVRKIEAAHERELQWLKDATTREIEDANHERSEWRTEARLNQQTVAELTQQNQAMLSAFGPTLSDFLDSLRKVASQARDEVDEERDRV